ncbi:MAG: HlyD family efflux transporter periplasmic adaptor subunit [Clostridiales bacterium]|nr:HlyD family efflux transporter periplasmic adaptor subunit [Clostridiales bacterium]
MKKFLSILTLLLCLCISFTALAELSFEGTVVSGASVSISAPFGGTVESMKLREGSVLNAGDVITTISTTKVYAPSAGRVVSIFAEPGDSLESVSALYGAPLYLTPENLYSIEADIMYGYSSTENRYITSGETVYVSCTSDDGKHTAQGLVTTVTGTTFTVLVTDGELKVDEEVRIYRDSNHSAKLKIGGGTVARVSDVAVNGTGSLLYMHVAEGDMVERGQLLYETVGGTLDGLYATDNQVIAERGGIVATITAKTGTPVNKGDSLLTLYPRDSLRIEITISEYDLASIKEGDPVTFTLNYQDGQETPVRYQGVVEQISYVGTLEGGEVSYKGYISFEYDEAIRLGMGAVVELQ